MSYQQRSTTSQVPIPTVEEAPSEQGLPDLFPELAPLHFDDPFMDRVNEMTSPVVEDPSWALDRSMPVADPGLASRDDFEPLPAPVDPAPTSMGPPDTAPRSKRSRKERSELPKRTSKRLEGRRTTIVRSDPSLGEIPVLQLGQYAKGSTTGRSPLGASGDAAQALIAPQKRRPVTGDKRPYLEHHFQESRKSGRSHVHTGVDPDAGHRRTIGLFDAPSGSHERDTTPIAPHKLGADESGHGFPQAYLRDPSVADRTEHMYAQSPLNNRGSTSTLERMGADLAKGSNPIMKVMVGLGLERPTGFIEGLYERVGEEAWEQIAILASTNPTLESLADGTYDVLDEADPSFVDLFLKGPHRDPPPDGDDGMVT